jgi:hypothetical protein
VCVHDVVVVLGCVEVVMDVHILHPRPEKIPLTTNVSQKLPSAIFDDPSIDWLSVQKDIVIQILWKLILTILISLDGHLYATGDMN